MHHRGPDFGANHIEATCQDVVNTVGTEACIESHWIKGANINLMLPHEWMSQGTDPNQRTLGRMQGKERRGHREEEEPSPQRRQLAQSVGQQECVGVAVGCTVVCSAESRVELDLEDICTSMVPLLSFCQCQSRDKPLEQFVHPTAI